ncbi:hypothetical protein KVT40_007212 [Elsinoe batatas]|uniref:Uncharacterized protein n=1 Tax=Elsinoe batatas TaxID=2601811 RepID=A0A8K0L0N1_9PEZI|nr:hypothetical protein KVT40_007212 [Elsinoe batatas]
MYQKKRCRGKVARTRGSLGSGIVVVIFGTVSSFPFHSPDSRQLALREAPRTDCLGDGWISKKAYQPIEDSHRHLSKSLGPRVHILLCRQLAPVHAI